MTKQELTTTAAAPAIVICGNCGIEERRLLHHVRHRGIFRRLCTTCVLRLHPQNFCPTCFLVYENTPPSDSVTCFKCYSSSHPGCAPTPTPSKTNYICPSCINPNIPIFSLKKVKEGFGEGENCRVIDTRAAKILLAGARIATISMNRAAVTAKAEAERRAKEAAFTKKRAREALENLVYLMANEKKKVQKVGSVDRSVLFRPRVNGSSGVGVNGSSGGVGVNGSGGGVGGDRVDSSSEVLAALNAVELKEKEKEIVKVPEVEIIVSDVGSDSVVMEVDDTKSFGGLSACKNSENGMIMNSGKSEEVEVKKASDTLLLAPSDVDPLMSEKSSNLMEENIST